MYTQSGGSTGVLGQRPPQDPAGGWAGTVALSAERSVLVMSAGIGAEVLRRLRNFAAADRPVLLLPPLYATGIGRLALPTRDCARLAEHACGVGELRVAGTLVCPREPEAVPIGVLAGRPVADPVWLVAPDAAAAPWMPELLAGVLRAVTAPEQQQWRAARERERDVLPEQERLAVEWEQLAIALAGTRW
ncbi:hypothetical protein [Kitasatospora sp. NPDC088783]|uniref:hypothetical protein n=1 Tax=Kitasatospora sp. NPDC088783 TaxID=3364077 RepID=UPI0037F5723E